jgi:hypothetical protein
MQDQLKNFEAELAHQDREFAAAMAILEEHVAADAQFALPDELFGEFEDAWSATEVLRPAPTPVFGARC